MPADNPGTSGVGEARAGTVGTFQIDKVLHRIGGKPGWEAFQQDPEPFLQDIELDPTERQALLSGDPKALEQMGANAYLLLRYASWNGLVGGRRAAPNAPTSTPVTIAGTDATLSEVRAAPAPSPHAAGTAATVHA